MRLAMRFSDQTADKARKNVLNLELTGAIIDMNAWPDPNHNPHPVISSTHQYARWHDARAPGGRLGFCLVAGNDSHLKTVPQVETNLHHGVSLLIFGLINAHPACVLFGLVPTVNSGINCPAHDQ